MSQPLIHICSLKGKQPSVALLLLLRGNNWGPPATPTIIIKVSQGKKNVNRAAVMPTQPLCSGNPTAPIYGIMAAQAQRRYARAPLLVVAELDSSGFFSSENSPLGMPTRPISPCQPCGCPGNLPAFLVPHSGLSRQSNLISGPLVSLPWTVRCVDNAHCPRVRPHALEHVLQAM